MSIIALSRGFRSQNTKVPTLSILYPSLSFYRAASLSSAIGKGIRRSKGVGFRGKEKVRSDYGRNREGGDVRKESGGSEKRDNGRKDTKPEPGKAGVVRRHVGPPGPVKSGMTYKGWEGPIRKASEAYASSGSPRRKITDQEDANKGYDSPRSPREGPTRIRMGKRILKEDAGKRLKGGMEPEKHAFGKRSLARRLASEGISPSQGYGKELVDKYSKEPRQSNWGPSKTGADSRSLGRSGDGQKSYEPRSSYGKSSDEPPRFRLRTSSGEYQPVGGDNAGVPASPTFKKSFDKRIPISIPYTTPASEFLYGTSVVESALKSKRTIRRKLYKLYIYTGQNRENPEEDAKLERLARRQGVEVLRVDGDWLRAMDKMSNSRPHNGYILEASPLPRLPLTHLGEYVEQEDESTISVSLDYQSREEAAVNGTSDTITLPKNPLGRKPFVLFLDSILDPGNLGGIIRSASFMGVTAIAISKNCAEFTPAVLKASAGASENITLFTVNKPAGFIANSRLAGWKIFAAVAPYGEGPKPISTDLLDNPLADDPCILMLGGEGDGLRSNLRSKAHVNLTIKGHGSHSVDSLNVSVATGILCNAFLRRTDLKKPAVAKPVEVEAEPEVPREASVLF